MVLGSRSSLTRLWRIWRRIETDSEYASNFHDDHAVVEHSKQDNGDSDSDSKDCVEYFGKF